MSRKQMGLQEIEMTHRTKENLMSLLRIFTKTSLPENWMIGKTNNWHPLDTRTIISIPKLNE